MGFPADNFMTMTRYKLIRDTLGFSKPFVSNYTGIPEDRLDEIEHNLVNPTDTEIEKLCDFYGVNRNDLLRTEEENDILLKNGLSDKDIQSLSNADEQEIFNLLQTRNSLVNEDTYER